MSGETIVLIVAAWLCFSVPIGIGIGRFIARGNREAEAERREVDGPLLGLVPDPERRTRAFLAASNSKGRRINAFRTDNERAAAPRKRPAA